MYRRAKRDANEAEIREYLSRVGASVVQIDAEGVPDLLVGWNGYTILMEVKSKAGKLTPVQVEFFKRWKGDAHVVRSIGDVNHVLKRHAAGKLYVDKQ